MILFDSHAHYYDEKYGDELEETVKAIREAGVRYVLNAGTTPETSRQALSLAEKYDGFYAAVGIHPENIDEIDKEAAFDEIKTLLKHEKAVAIGEIGLDYHWRDDNKEEQKYWFRKQLEYALETDTPVIIHDREAHGDCLKIVKEYKGVRGVFHSYSGSADMAKELLKLGWYISFSGVITFKNNVKATEVVPIIPDDRILIETDCPYLAPVPHRGERNHSGFMTFTAEKMASLRSVTVDEIAKTTLKNAATLFSISTTNMQ